MKKYAIIILALIIFPWTISAEITLRKGSYNTYAPKMQSARHNVFDDIFTVQPETKHYNISQQNNTYIKPQKQVRQGHNVSYLSSQTQNQTPTRQYVTGNSQDVKYYRYEIDNTLSRIDESLTASQNPSLKPFNEQIIETAPSQYAYGPPVEGPVSDVILPLLCFIGLYIVTKKRNM